MDKSRTTTVSDVARLIEARAAKQANLQELALEAYERWCELEQQVRDLEQPGAGEDCASQQRLRVERVAPASSSPRRAER